MKWTIHNNASHGTMYGKFDTKEDALAAAKRMAESGKIDKIDQEQRCVHFRRTPSL